MWQLASPLDLVVISTADDDGLNTALTSVCIDVADGLQQQQRVEFCVLNKDQQQLQWHLGHRTILRHSITTPNTTNTPTIIHTSRSNSISGKGQVTYSFCQLVRLRILEKGRLDRDDIWVGGSDGSKEWCIRWGSNPPWYVSGKFRGRNRVVQSNIHTSTPLPKLLWDFSFWFITTTVAVLQQNPDWF